jgi:hypothetical protein
MPIFPEMPVPGLPGLPTASSNGLPSNGAAGDLTGVVSGLNTSLLSMLASYDPGEGGVRFLDNTLRVVLPLVDWDSYEYFHKGTVSLTGGAIDPVAIATVPGDERWSIEYVLTRVASGDNKIEAIAIDYPLAYRSGSEQCLIKVLTTTGPVCYWPDPGGAQPSDRIVNFSPLRLEPEAVVYVDPIGSGVATTVIAFEIIMTRTKVVRVLAPSG